MLNHCCLLLLKNGPPSRRVERRQKKSPAFQRDLSCSLTGPANGPDLGSASDGRDSASHGPDPAAADPASGRHPAAAASDPVSGSAGPGSGSCWSLRDLRCLTIAGINGESGRLLQENIGSAAIIARQRRGRTVKREPLRKN